MKKGLFYPSLLNYQEQMQLHITSIFKKTHLFLVIQFRCTK